MSDAGDEESHGGRLGHGRALSRRDEAGEVAKRLGDIGRPGCRGRRRSDQVVGLGRGAAERRRGGQPSRWVGSLMGVGSSTTVPSRSRALYGFVPRTCSPKPGRSTVHGASWTLSAARYWMITALRGFEPRFAAELWSMLQWCISTPPAGEVAFTQCDSSGMTL